jgi:hypothetical protein
VLVIEHGEIAMDIRIGLSRPRHRGSAEVAALEGADPGKPVWRRRSQSSTEWNRSKLSRCDERGLISAFGP